MAHEYHTVTFQKLIRYWFCRMKGNMPWIGTSICMQHTNLVYFIFVYIVKIYMNRIHPSAWDCKKVFLNIMQYMMRLRSMLNTCNRSYFSLRTKRCNLITNRSILVQLKYLNRASNNIQITIAYFASKPSAAFNTIDER